MPDTARIYDCGCLDGPEEFEPCRKARRLEDRMHDAMLEWQGTQSHSSVMAQYPLTCDDPEYFERRHTLAETSGKLAAVALELKSQHERAERANRRANRAHKAISQHITVQSQRGQYREEVVEGPPEDEFDQADLM